MTDPVLLPSSPRARSLMPEYVDAGGVLRGSHGGSAQTISRLGDHWAVSVDLPTMKWERDARLWVNRLILGQVRKKVQFEIYMPGFKVGVPGSPIVDGAVAGGSFLPLKNVTPNYDFQPLQFVSVIHDGIRYLHAVDEQTIVGENGKVNLPITPMLRTDLSDGDAVEVGQVFIEGHLVGDRRSWTIDEARTTGLSFQIEELV